VSNIAGRIVVGVDGSTGSLQALRYAVGHARAVGGLLVPVLAWTPPGGESAYRRQHASPSSWDWRPGAEQRLRTAFDEALGGLPGDLDVDMTPRRGPAGQVLVATANRSNDLLVVGAGRRGTLRNALHASTSHYCLTHAQCTVIAVAPSPLARHLDSGWSSLRPRRVPRQSADLPARVDRVREQHGAGIPR